MTSSRSLRRDIKARGLLQPIVLDAEGRVLDGRNRLAACEKAGIEPMFETYAGATVGLLQLVASIVAGLLWDRVGVFYYGAVFAVVGSIGLLLLIPGKHDN
jgi:ParB-like nuclease domain